MLYLWVKFRVLIGYSGEFEYARDYSELFSVALGSILDQWGYEVVSFDPISSSINSADGNVWDFSDHNLSAIKEEHL